MKFMLTWRTRPGLYKAAFQQFLETGGPPPKGVEQVARYHVPGSVLGWHVLETNDMTALAEHVNTPEFGFVRAVVIEAYYSDFVAPGKEGPGAWAEIDFNSPQATRLAKDWSYLGIS